MGFFDTGSTAGGWSDFLVFKLFCFNLIRMVSPNHHSFV